MASQTMGLECRKGRGHAVAARWPASGFSHPRLGEKPSHQRKRTSGHLKGVLSQPVRARRCVSFMSHTGLVQPLLGRDHLHRLVTLPVDVGHVHSLIDTGLAILAVSTIYNFFDKLVIRLHVRD